MAMGLGGKVTNGDHKLTGIFAPTDKGHHTMAVVGAINPLEAGLFKIVAIKSGFVDVEVVQFGENCLSW